MLTLPPSEPVARKKEIGGSGGSLGPPVPLLTHLHTVCMGYSECLPTRLNPLAERACFSQVYVDVKLSDTICPRPPGAAKRP